MQPHLLLCAAGLNNTVPRSSCRNCIQNCPQYLRHQHQLDSLCAHCRCPADMHESVDQPSWLSSFTLKSDAAIAVGDIITLPKHQGTAVVAAVHPPMHCKVQQLNCGHRAATAHNTTLEAHALRPESKAAERDAAARESAALPAPVVVMGQGLPGLARAVCRGRARVCFIGGSITMQKQGYRPMVLQQMHMQGIEVEEIPSYIGGAGSKQLAMMERRIYTPPSTGSKLSVAAR